MRDDNKARRQMQIEKAAYAVLAEHGYAGTSMLKIAKKAKASNETLYNWYGDKQGLFRALVERNAADIGKILVDGLAADVPAIETLQALGPKLLAMLIGKRAVALNRAAAADATGTLGKTISELGRQTIAPLIGQLLVKADHEGVLQITDAREAATIYINLLIGDLQIRRAIGFEPEPDEDFVRRRSKLALGCFLRLMAPAPGRT